MLNGFGQTQKQLGLVIRKDEGDRLSRGHFQKRLMHPSIPFPFLLEPLQVYNYVTLLIVITTAITELLQENISLSVGLLTRPCPFLSRFCPRLKINTIL